MIVSMVGFLASLLIVAVGYRAEQTRTEVHTVERLLPTIKRTGSPCRTAVAEDGFPKGLYDQECARQSDFVAWSYCIRHSRAASSPICLSLPPRLQTIREESVSAKKAREQRGGGSQSPQQGGQLPGGGHAPRR